MAQHVLDIQGRDDDTGKRVYLSADTKKHLQGFASINFTSKELKLLGLNRQHVTASYVEIVARATHAVRMRLRDAGKVAELSTQDLLVIANLATQRMQELEAADGTKQEAIDWSKFDADKFNSPSNTTTGRNTP